MAMGREGDRQGDLIVTWSEMPRSPGRMVVFGDPLGAASNGRARWRMAICGCLRD